MIDPHAISKKLFIESMAKHLPPSGSRLKLWDVGGNAGDVLTSLRQDLMFEAINDFPEEPDVLDSIVVYTAGNVSDAKFLASALTVLRPGGRLIMVNPNREPNKLIVNLLETIGFTRILVEPAIETPQAMGVLIRGEKPHRSASTFARIHVAANADANHQFLATYDGAYVFLLVRQLPNKPIWALADGERVTWDALTIEDKQTEQHIIAFTSLPKAVSLMQPAVMQGTIENVNKVGKFSRETALSWDLPILLNPTLDQFTDSIIAFVPIDPASAEAPDE